jgi:transaldolase
VALGAKVNVTAIMTARQVADVAKFLNPKVPSYVSVFAGRIADTGMDPTDIMVNSLKILEPNKNAELIWASPRELLNIFQANDIGCHIITATNDILSKIPLIGYSLDQFSLDTVKMFRRDAIESGFSL